MYGMCRCIIFERVNDCESALKVSLSRISTTLHIVGLYVTMCSARLRRLSLRRQ